MLQAVFSACSIFIGEQPKCAKKLLALVKNA